LILAPPLAVEDDIETIFDPHTLALIRNHLRSGGTVCLPVPLKGLSTPGVEAAVARFGRVFRRASAWFAGTDLLLIAGGGPGEGAPGGAPIDRIGERFLRPGVGQDLQLLGIEDSLKLLSLRAFVLPAGSDPGAGAEGAVDLESSAADARLHDR